MEMDGMLSSVVDVDPVYRIVSRGKNGKVRLTAREFQIFVNFLEAPGNAMTRDQFASRVWQDTKVSRKTLDVHIYNLRRKLNRVHLGIESLRDGARSFVLKQDPVI